VLPAFKDVAPVDLHTSRDSRLCCTPPSYAAAANADVSQTRRVILTGAYAEMFPAAQSRAALLAIAVPGL